jgi:hypothetical protein
VNLTICEILEVFLIHVPTSPKQNNRVPLVITYSKALPNIHEILKKNIKILYNSEKMKRIFDERL